MGTQGRIREPKTSPRRLQVALRRAEAVKLRLAGIEYQEIATRLGYGSRGAAAQDVQRHLEALTREPTEELRTLELQRLDLLWQTAMGILARRHVTVSNGKVVHLDGSPVRDDGPVMQAIDRLLKIQERRAKLLGLDGIQRVMDNAVDAWLNHLTGSDTAAETEPSEV